MIAFKSPIAFIHALPSKSANHYPHL